MTAEQLTQQLQTLKSASRKLALISTAEKNQVLLKLVEKLQQSKGQLLSENNKDIEDFKSHPKFTKALADRLALSPARIEGMVKSIQKIVEEIDFVGKKQGQRVLQNGLALEQVRVPIGVIFFIFESRPNVITEAFALAFKSGNVMLMKGGRESSHSSAFLYKLIEQSLLECGLSGDFIFGITSADRSISDFLMKQDKYIDLLIPRGGEALIEYVTEHSRIPLIKNDRGMCHVYLDARADLQMAEQIVTNAKTQRPGVCNAMETLLVHSALGTRPEVEKLLMGLHQKGVEIFACEKSQKLFANCHFLQKADAQSFCTEYLDLKMNLKVVADLSEALEHIFKYGSKHSEVIVTEDAVVAKDFLDTVDAAVVYWNASSRFTDGYEFGLGGEIGISTQKLHVRGPIGLEALTCLKWVVQGQGQVRA